MTRNNSVLPFSTKRSRIEANFVAPEGSVVWPVGELPDERQCGEWLDQVIIGTPHEATLLSLWRNHPNLRLATERLASYITPRWPAPNGQPLLKVAVERAVERVDEAISNGHAFEGVVVGKYLAGLLSVRNDIAQLVIRGEDRRGQIRRWEYFSQPLLLWAYQHGIKQVIVSHVEAPPSDVVMEGLRPHMIACLADPVDAGYLVKHAALG